MCGNIITKEIPHCADSDVFVCGNNINGSSGWQGSVCEEILADNGVSVRKQWHWEEVIKCALEIWQESLGIM